MDRGGVINEDLMEEMEVQVMAKFQALIAVATKRINEISSMELYLYSNKEKICIAGAR